ncbi:MAG TPA: TIGR00266 family protein [Methanoregulaceae archaeon]|nr:TIGR00266 family protein [Methanoregulaceae archaeon]
MKQEIIGANLQMVRMELGAGEGILAEAGAMVNMSGNIQMQSQMTGGIISGIKRVIAGESLFLTKFFPNEKPGFVSFAGSVPGKIFEVRLATGRTFIAQRDSFLCCEEGVLLDIALVKKIRSGLFGGSGFVLQEMSGEGTAFLHCCGDILTLSLQEGEIIKVQTGLVVGFESTVTYDISLVGGITSILFGGEGLFVTTLTGPGTVVLQSMDLAKIAATIVPYLPQPKEEAKNK